MHIKPERVLESFRRLHIRPELGEGVLKRGRERTSALSVFLAYDMTERGQGVLSLNPDSEDGKHNRAKFSTAFSKVTLLRGLAGRRALATYDFGEVTFCPKPKQMPDSKLTDNFLTTRLKQAADQGKPLKYPMRPPGSPLLLLGPEENSGSDDRWAVKADPAWWDSFTRLLADRRSNTIFLDLTVFLLRDSDLQHGSDGVGTLETGLRASYSSGFASSLIAKIKSETRLQESKWLLRDNTWLQDGHTPAFNEQDFPPPANTEQRLRAYIKDLQSVLDDYGYQYDPTPE